LAAVIVLISGFLDALDGKIARLSGKAGRRGDFVDHVIDRYADVIMIGAVAVSAWCNPYLGMMAIIGVLLTSYMGTQAQAVGAGRHYAGLLGRADRLVLMVAACLVQWVFFLFGIVWIELSFVSFTVFEVMMLWFAVVGNLTAIQRAYSTWKFLK
jgi:archaetidylinositol phosphate synthase